MSKFYIPYFLGTIAIVTVLVVYFLWLPTPSEVPVYDKKVYIRYSFLLKNKGNQIIENAKFLMFAPYQSNARQKLMAYTASQSSELVSEDNGNSFFAVSDLFIPPYGSKTLNISLEIATTTNMVEVKESNLEPYLENDLFLNMDAPKLVELAAQFKGQDHKQMSKDIYTWLVNNIQVLNYVAQAKGAKYAIEQKSGDCTEMMHAFMALARLNGIPARAVGGFVVEGNATVVHANDYHNWAEYYNGKRWVVVDPQKQILDDTGNLTYVTFRYIGKQQDEELYTQRFVVSDVGIAVSML